MQLAPDQILVALSLKFGDDMRTAQIEDQVIAVERKVRAAYPQVVAARGSAPRPMFEDDLSWVSQVAPLAGCSESSSKSVLQPGQAISVTGNWS